MEFNWTTEDGTVGRILFDTSDEEVPENSSTVTEHPIETGSNVNDHIILGQTRIRLRGTISNTPLRQPETQFNTTASSRSADLGGGTTREHDEGAQRSQAAKYVEAEQRLSATVLQFDGDFDRVVDVYAELLGLHNNRQLFTLTTSLRSWDQCYLESVSAPRDNSSGSSIEFEMSAVQLVFADSQIVSAPEPLEPRTSRQSARGSQNAEEASEEDNRSVAARAVDWGSEQFSRLSN